MLPNDRACADAAVMAEKGRAVRHVVTALAVVVTATGCAAHASRPAASPAAAARDPRTVAALLRIATVFNRQYDSGDYGPVYGRWDTRSRAIITRAEYIRRHTECPAEPQPAAHVEDASPGPRGAWLVDYQIGGEQLTDYWFYVHGRWVFDLVLSNPSAVKLYRLSPHQYAVAIGCAR
jgi:hypothetical protein